MSARVAILVPYSSFWQPMVGGDFRAERAAIGERARGAAGGAVDVVHVAPVGSREEGRRFSEEARERGADIVLVLETMGTQPAFTFAALDELDCPLVVWWAQTLTPQPDSFDELELVLEGGAVGTPMLTNGLVRRRRPFALVAGGLDDPTAHVDLQRALRVAGAAAVLRRSRIGHVGLPIDGYDCVEADEEPLMRDVVGLVVHIEPAEIRRRFLQLARTDADAVEEELRSSYAVAADVGADSMHRSAKFAAVIEQLCEEERLDAGVMNCHVADIRFAEDVGVTPCLGLGRSTTRGIPWTCAGDILTVVPMLALKLLGAPALYHELEAYNAKRNEFVLSNTGEHELGLASGEPPQVVMNGWFRHDPRCGTCVRHTLRAGAAAIVGFTQIGDTHRLIVARGELTDTSWPRLTSPNGSFRFAAGVDGWLRWCEAGANHHSALTTGEAAAEVCELARLLPLELVEIG